MITVFENKENCCGCTACLHICPQDAISMEFDKEGFLYPHIDQEKCVDCKKCIQVCAFQNKNKVSNTLNPPKVFAAKHISDEVRERSTSGGLFTAISDFVLNTGGIVYGAAFDDKLKVVHVRATEETTRNVCCGSKYVQSELGDTFKSVASDLLSEKLVLFTGTPCQVASLNRYLEKRKVSVQKLLTADLICHGTPSPVIFADYLRFVETKFRKRLCDYKFRPKSLGWGHIEEAVFADGSREFNNPVTSVHKALFHSKLCLRPACHVCRYANISRPSDITMADFWGIEEVLPGFADKLGVSAAIINTTKGEYLFEKVKDYLFLEESTIEDVAAKQTNLYTPTKANRRRKKFWIDYRNKGFEYVAKKYGGYGTLNAIQRKIYRFIKNMAF